MLEEPEYSIKSEGDEVSGGGRRVTIPAKAGIQRAVIPANLVP